MIHSPSCRCLKAAKLGDLQFLQSKAHTVEKFRLEEISRSAATEGHVEVLQWAREQGCLRSDVRICAAAAANGHLAVLQYAHHHAICPSERLCLERKHVRGSSQRRPPGSAAVCPPQRLCLVLKHMRGGSQRRPPGSFAVCPSERLRLAFKHL